MARIPKFRNRQETITITTEDHDLTCANGNTGVLESTEITENWKRRTYAIGLGFGAVVGILSAYLFARAAEENSTRSDGKPEPIPTTQLFGVVLAVIGVARQIAEMGKPKDNKR